MCNTENATERLNREYVENALSLAESFTHQWWAYFKAGNEAAAQSALGRAEHFYRDAAQMLRFIEDKETSRALSAQLGQLRRRGLTRSVA